MTKTWVCIISEAIYKKTSGIRCQAFAAAEKDEIFIWSKRTSWLGLWRQSRWVPIKPKFTSCRLDCFGALSFGFFAIVIFSVACSFYGLQSNWVICQHYLPALSSWTGFIKRLWWRKQFGLDCSIFGFCCFWHFIGFVKPCFGVCTEKNNPNWKITLKEVQHRKQWYLYY